MADDIFLSPEEQDERAKQWLKDNGLALVVGIGLGLAAVVGYNKYQDNLLIKAEQASGLYGAALSAVTESAQASIDAHVDSLKADHASSSYSAKAVLIKAKQLAVSDTTAALKELQWVVENAPEAGLVHAAKIRQAKIHFTEGNFESATLIANAEGSQDGFESHYSELLADISAKQGDFEKAKAHYEKAIDTLQASDSGYAQLLSIKIDRLPIVGAVSDAESDVEEPDDTEAESTEAESLEGSE